jgi:hypothetical protein
MGPQGIIGPCNSGALSVLVGLAPGKNLISQDAGASLLGKLTQNKQLVDLGTGAAVWGPNQVLRARF